MCLDWILASTEYIEFVYMMLEFKVSLCQYDLVRARKTGTVKTMSIMLVKLTSTVERMKMKRVVVIRLEDEVVGLNDNKHINSMSHIIRQEIDVVQY
jgi:hypothetical protein